MVYFQTKNPNLGKFWRTSGGKMLMNFMTIWNILQTFGTFYISPFGTFCAHLVHFSGFGIMYQEKSGNPAAVPVSLIIRESIPFHCDVGQID
jgi:hypothetical protein